MSAVALWSVRSGGKERGGVGLLFMMLQFLECEMEFWRENNIKYNKIKCLHLNQRLIGLSVCRLGAPVTVINYFFYFYFSVLMCW